MFDRILIAVDISEPHAPAITTGTELARRLAARVALLHVADPSLAYTPESGVLPDELLAQERLSGKETLHGIAARFPDLEVEMLVREGKPAEEIVAAARDWGADLLVMGTHGRKGLARLLLGSTVDSVIRAAPCPTLAVRDAGGEHGASEPEA